MCCMCCKQQPHARQQPEKRTSPNSRGRLPRRTEKVGSAINPEDSIDSCSRCNGDSHSRIGLFSHGRRCNTPQAVQPQQMPQYNPNCPSTADAAVQHKPTSHTRHCAQYNLCKLSEVTAAVGASVLSPMEANDVSVFTDCKVTGSSSLHIILNPWTFGKLSSQVKNCFGIVYTRGQKHVGWHACRRLHPKD